MFALFVAMLAAAAIEPRFENPAPAMIQVVELDESSLSDDERRENAKRRLDIFKEVNRKQAERGGIPASVLKWTLTIPGSGCPRNTVNVYLSGNGWAETRIFVSVCNTALPEQILGLMEATPPMPFRAD